MKKSNSKKGLSFIKQTVCTLNNKELKTLLGGNGGGVTFITKVTKPSGAGTN